MPARYIETRYVDPDQLRPYPGNPNRGDVDVVRGSVRRNGQYRSVVARQLPDGALELLAGHTTTQATADVEGRVRVEVIDADDATARRIVAADNQTARKATMDEAALLDLLDEAKTDGGLDGTGYTDKDLDALLERAENGDDAGAYTTKVNVPQYEPVGTLPPVTSLRDETRADALRARIRATPGLDPEIRDYLLAAAARHTVFNYRAAAEFYPHASAEVQALMEESALVIIDVEDAIAHGFVSLSETINELRERDAAARAAGEDAGDGD